MELIDLLKEEIKKLASEENINVSKLNEHIHIYERLKMYQVTSVQEMEMSQRRYDFVGSTNMIAAQPRDNLGGMLDIFKDAVHMQMQNMPHKRNEIDEYIFWARFLKDVREDITGYWGWERDKDQIIEDVDKLMEDVCVRTIQLMRKKLKDNIDGKIIEENTTTAIVPEVIT